LTQSRRIVRFLCAFASSLADDVERLVDVALGDAAVRAERDDDELGQVILVLRLADHVEALGPLPAATGIRAVADLGEVGQGEQHRRVADRQRRPAEVRILTRLLHLRGAAGRGRDRRAQRQHREQRRQRPRQDII
jgi:hypothetical protein